MKYSIQYSLLLLLLCAGLVVQAQEARYRYSMDLQQVQNDQLEVNLLVPPIEQKEIHFHMPAIIPGTYRISNYGLFVDNLRAFDKRGRSLPVEKVDTNSWKINKAHRLERITYLVEDIFDTEQDNNIYYMSGTNIDAGHNFVINTPGFFGYFEGMKEIPFELSITKPEGFYGSTGLIPQSTTPTQDIYLTQDYDLLMDSPMMYNKPDTTFIEVGNARVLVSVYSPNGMVNSEFLADKFNKLLQATAEYLGGELPVEKYAFLLYFESPATVRNDRAGALEHSYSSFYYLPEYPQANMAPLLVDIAAHEFFHIVTPLTIHSEEIANFDFNEARLSQHLWLYEGVTEYASDHVQVRYNHITPNEFLDKLAEKINNSKHSYNDNLPFTELSRKAAGEHSDQYGNVYEKGALIGALLDILLLEQSGGEYELQKLMRDLSKRFGPEQPFRDEELFGVIEELSYPAAGEFLRRYVDGTESLPFEEYFEKAGVRFHQEAGKEVASLGNISLNFYEERGRIEIVDVSQVNDFGRAMGFRKGDLILQLQGQDVQAQNAQQVLEDYSINTRAGDTVNMVVDRRNEAGEYEQIRLSAPAQLISSEGLYSLSLMENPTFEQLELRNQWLQAKPVTARPEDVSSVDAIVKSLYDVISGPAGERNWKRFHSLFKPESRMAAISGPADGPLSMVSMTPKEYQEKNGPHFMRSGFYEEELGRRTQEFGEIAHIWSAYQFRLQENEQPAQRGINSIQLVYDQSRWWITSILWNSERPSNEIPEEMLGSQTRE